MFYHIYRLFELYNHILFVFIAIIYNNFFTVNTSEKGLSMSLFMTDAFARLRTSGLISLCLINGPAVGGGSELTTVCDYR
jgi:enoyl-CoA hydratase/carnithine racemase